MKLVSYKAEALISELLEAVEEYEKLRNLTYDEKKYGENYLSALKEQQKVMFGAAKRLREALKGPQGA